MKEAGVQMYGRQSIRLVLPDGVGSEPLQELLKGETRQQETRLLTFWDTFEWGLWFGGHLLVSCGHTWSLSTREEGWPGTELCREEGGGRRRFWQDFETPAMRERLEGLLGLRGLAPVAEGTFRRRLDELRNEAGKIVCRVAWESVTAGKRGEELHRSCRVLPLLGFEPEAAQVVAELVGAGADREGEGPLAPLLRHAERLPRIYTLRPLFGLTGETPAREAVGRIVRAMLALAAENVPGILDDLDTEFLHDYRICLRKIRALLSLLKGVYPLEETGRIRAVLGGVARQTNRLRDLDVYLLAREEYCALLPPGIRPMLDDMFAAFSAERKDEFRRVITELRPALRQGLFRDIERYVAPETLHGPSPAAELAVGPLAFGRIGKRYRKIRGIAREIGPDTPDEAIHQLRIECKKLRYLMEFFAELIPAAEGAALVKLLKRLQGRLGDFNDASVQQKSLLAYRERKRTGSDTLLALGGLVAVLYQRQQQTRDLIHQALDEFCSEATAATFKRLFKQGPVHPVPAGEGSSRT